MATRFVGGWGILGMYIHGIFSILYFTSFRMLLSSFHFSLFNRFLFFSLLLYLATPYAPPKMAFSRRLLLPVCVNIPRKSDIPPQNEARTRISLATW